MRKSQLLILGNGFDLHCGLKSSYKDFFRGEILDTIGERYGLIQFSAGVSGFWENLLLAYYNINNNTDYNWCDIEAIIKDTLWQLFVKSSLSDGGLWNYALESVKIKRDLNDPGIKFNYIEAYLLDYCISFISKTKKRYMRNDDITKLMIRELYQELHCLEQRFCKYLKNQIVNPNNENELNEKYLVKAANLLAKLTGVAYYEFNNLDEIITVDNKNRLADIFDELNDAFILNFNYTALFDILEVENPCCHNNVHGKLCNEHCVKDCNDSNIIFGIDDNLIQSQGASSDFRLFSKTYRKMLNSDKYIMTLPPNDDNSIEIKFYGHSLSEADYSYFQSIFDYYDLYSNSNISLTFYYSKGFENYDAVYRLISSYGKSLTNKEQGKNLIHKLLLENRLHIQEIKD